MNGEFTEALIDTIQKACERFAAWTALGDADRAEAWLEIAFGLAALLPNLEQTLADA